MTAIDILLATYNGARFLPEQLRSLEEQTFRDWQLVVRDDGSTDGSVAVVEEWAARTGRPIRIIKDGRTGLGAMGNFGALLEASDAPYFALCDQDDVWLPDKLSLMLKRLQEAEARYGEHMPRLAYSDLRVVDEQLKEIHPSFRTFAFLRLPRPGLALIDVMTQNVVAGCASLGNSALRQAALPIPGEAVMHDWWLALTAGAVGELVDIPEATVLYRQHGQNAVGAVRWTAGAVLLRLRSNFAESVRSMRSFFADTQRQALVFHGRFGNKIDTEISALMYRYGVLSAQSILKRKVFAHHHLSKSRRFLRNIAILIFI